MNEIKKQKSEKYWLNIGILLAGVLGSLFLVYFSYKKYTDTAEQYPVPKEIINIKEEIEPSLETLKASDKSIVEKYRSIKNINKILGENDLGFTHHWLLSIAYSLKLKQKLHHSKKTSQNFIQTLNLELSNSYGLEENNEGITSLQKKTKLIFLFQLGNLSCLVAFYMIIKIIIYYSLIINSNEKNIFFIPEECVAELEVIHKELKSSGKNIWIIRFIMLWNIIVLLKSLYIQVAIENMLLPGKNKRD